MTLDISCCNCENFTISNNKPYCLKCKINVGTYDFCNKFEEDEFIKDIKLNQYHEVR
ncbi:hypothetical protein UMC2_35481 [[Clostridium] sordellii]|uniref:hypothetical protein n=1 Tax=Paraclostridium sordellii TaxID=1505 RepID=UPI000542F384|nr:hypothetical protein [Paeniclostridium sordellii]CEK34337.1 hypothetical protein UMC2_35481 [[Clostridium] sordellii] [Paeniclostridium sordellii]